MQPMETKALDVIKCATNHLTPFGGGLIVPPNKIDFDYVFANASFENNISIYVSLLLIFAVFAVLLVACRWMDISVSCHPLPVHALCEPRAT